MTLAAAKARMASTVASSTASRICVEIESFMAPAGERRRDRRDERGGRPGQPVSATDMPAGCVSAAGAGIEEAATVSVAIDTAKSAISESLSIKLAFGGCCPTAPTLRRQN